MTLSFMFEAPLLFSRIRLVSCNGHQAGESSATPGHADHGCEPFAVSEVSGYHAAPSALRE